MITREQIMRANSIYNGILCDTGYEPMTTFWNDFEIAERFGTKAIKDTFKTVFKNWKNSYKYLTELVLVLNWKIWGYYETNEEVAGVYNELWKQAQDYAFENLTEEELNYFIRTTD